jgi:magnesium chelatase accessory protein
VTKEAIHLHAVGMEGANEPLMANDPYDENALWERDKRTWPNHEASRFVEAGGIRWHVQQTGRGPALLLIHGTGASTHSWRDLLPMLGREYSVLSVDLPGHGFTDPVTATRSSIKGMSDLIAALLRTLQVSPQYCVGHSAGAVILCRMALDGHIAPRAIVSINGAFVPFGGAARLLLAPAARFLADSPFMLRLISQRASNPANVARVIAGTGSTLDAAGIELYVRLVSNPKHLAGVLRMMSNWDLHSFERELPRLTTPLALMVGENDLTVPMCQALKAKQSVKNATVFTLPRLGHLAHEEQPALVAQEILRICRAT